MSGSKKATPIGPLKIAYLPGSELIANAVDKYIVSTRKRHVENDPELKDLSGYLEPTYITGFKTRCMGTGERIIKLDNSVRGSDFYIIADVTNSNVTYQIAGRTNHMSPDNYFQDIKRIISATKGSTARTTVIMPFLYEGRQHKRTGRESLDCALALKELAAYDVSEIITFDAHDPSVQNAIPLKSFNNHMPTVQFVRALIKAVPDLTIDSDHLVVISPDEGAMFRAVYLANLLGIDVGLFYKRRDYSTIINGKNPIVAHEYLGDDLTGKDAIVMDDMIASGGSMLDVCRQLKDKGARRVFICTTFGLFTEGLEKFDKCYEDGLFHKLISTNLVYQSPELLKRPYYQTADMYKYLSDVIDTLNRNVSLHEIKGTTYKIQKIVEKETSK
ncbi:MAG: ribose-phosphate pyrophosphokinase [Lachnospiraceae bacterium]|jgi:ribose-phosphate pyrophosphokinase